MKTKWGRDLNPDAVLQEYPRPQLVRDRYINLEREHQVDVWYVFFVLSVLGNRSIVVFMGTLCSREQVNGFYPFGGTSRYMGFNSCHLRWQRN